MWCVGVYGFSRVATVHRIKPGRPRGGVNTVTLRDYPGPAYNAHLDWLPADIDSHRDLGNIGKMWLTAEPISRA